MLVDKRIVDGLLDLLQMEFCNYNPYHDKEGKFCSKDKANFFAKWNNAPTIELQPNEWDKIQDTKELRKVAKSYLLDVTRYLKLEKEGLGTIRFSRKSADEYISYSVDMSKLLNGFKLSCEAYNAIVDTDRGMVIATEAIDPYDDIVINLDF